MFAHCEVVQVFLGGRSLLTVCQHCLHQTEIATSKSLVIKWLLFLMCKCGTNQQEQISGSFIY